MFFWNSLAKMLWKIRGKGTGGRGNFSDCTGVTPVKREGKDFSGRASHCSTALSKCPGSWRESRLSFSHHHERIPEKVQTRVSSEVVISPRSSVKGLPSHALPQLPQLCCQGQKDDPVWIWLLWGCWILSSFACLYRCWFLLHIWNQTLAQYSNLGRRLFSFISLTMSCHSLLAWRISIERSAVSLMGIPLFIICCFPLAAFNIYSLYLIFVSLINMCLRVFHLGFNLFGTLWVSRTWMAISFTILGNFSTVISLSIVSCTFFLSSSSRTPVIQILGHLTLSQRSLRLSWFLLILFPHAAFHEALRWIFLFNKNSSQ